MNILIVFLPSQNLVINY